MGRRKEHGRSAPTSASETSPFKKMNPNLPQFVTYSFYKTILKLTVGDAILSGSSTPTEKREAEGFKTQKNLA